LKVNLLMPENEQAQDDTQACQNEAPYSHFNFNNFSRSAIAGASSGGGLGGLLKSAADIKRYKQTGHDSR
jgi:hypothetical protein